MLKNYLAIAWRNLRSSRGTAAINLLGLTIGIASCLLILLYVRYEWGYDRFHPEADKIFRVLTIDEALGVTSNEVAITLPALAEVMREEFPEVTQSLRISFAGSQVEKDQQRFNLDDVWRVEPSFQEMLGFGTLHGPQKEALAQPNTAIISARTAQKVFQREDVVGESLNVNGEDVQITAVLPNAPDQSHLQYDLLVSMLPSAADSNRAQYLNSWGSISMISYVKLANPGQEKEVEARMEELIRRHDVGENFRVTLQPLTEVHLGSDGIIFDSYNYNKGDRAYVLTLLLIAICVLLIAAFNYMNLATARSARRAKEVGLRKTIGANRMQLISQFMLEAIMLCLIAFIAALGLASLVGHWVTFSLPTNPTQYLLKDWPLLLGMLGGVILLGLAAGSYPAFLLSAYRPIQVLRGSFQRSKQGIWLRRVLVTVQFAASTAMIVGTVVVYQQLSLLQGMDKGFDPEQVLTFNLNSQSLRQNYERLSNDLRQIPGVTEVATVGSMPGQTYGRNRVEPEGYEGEDTWIVSVTSMDEHFIPLMEMEVIAGRGFDPSFGQDSVGRVLVNQAMVQALGWEGDAIGKQFGQGENAIQVAGVVKDFHFGGLQHQIEPLMMFYQPGANRTVALRVEAAQMEATLEQIEAVWGKINPQDPFEYQFFDEEFAQQFTQEQNFARLAVTFTWLAIFIACLGLLGLSAFAAEQRTKEIGIRKILGASIPQLMTLLSRELALIVGMAALLALPVAAYLMEDWLSGYAYRIDLPWWVFGLALFGALAIALLTNAYHALQISRRNPVRALRQE